jgi:hypothetical protein
VWEEPLRGGRNAEEVVKVGDTVRRARDRGSAFAARLADGAYARGAVMLRRLHDLTAGHPLAAGRECVLNGDAGPFNTVFQDGTPIAFIDWTSCRPGDRLNDLGYMAWTWCIQSEGNVPVDSQARHLRELRDAYGPVAPEAPLDAMIRNQNRILATSELVIWDARHPPARRAWAEETVRWASADRDLIRDNERFLLTALR